LFSRLIPNVIIKLDTGMRGAAGRLDFERAIQLRKLIKRLEKEVKTA
jgi:excinuclease ABC subunit B